MRHVGTFLLFATIAVAVGIVGFCPRAIREAGSPGKPISYTVEELRHEPAASWTQTTRMTDDEDWLVRTISPDGTHRRFYVSRETYEALRVGQEVQPVPPSWESTDPVKYTLIECQDDPT